MASTPSLDKRILDLRAGNVVVQVVDKSGRPVKNAIVRLEQTAHNFEFGVSLRTEMFQDKTNATHRTKYLNIVKELFNASVHEDALKWYSTESTQGQLNYADADRILQWSEQNKLRMRGHNLFWEVERWSQPWLKTLSSSALRTAAQNRATQICTRYRGRIGEYDVLNEILNGDFFQKRLGNGIIKDMFAWCRKADPAAVLYTNEYNILNGEQLDRYVALIRSLQAQKIPLGGIGVQAHFRQDVTADQMQRSLDTLAKLGLPIKITEFSAVGDTEQKQAQTLSDLYRVAFAHPAVVGIFMWGFWEGAIWERRSAIFKQNFEPKLAARTYRDLVRKQWWTNQTGKTSDRGEFSIRAFFGTYRLTVQAGKTIREQQFSVLPGSRSPQIVRLTLAQ